jgi:hypothetical protein
MPNSGNDDAPTPRQFVDQAILPNPNSKKVPMANQGAAEHPWIFRTQAVEQVQNLIPDSFWKFPQFATGAAYQLNG